MTRHSPGPWMWEPGDDTNTWFRLVDASCAGIQGARIYAGRGLSTDAALIAAAPRMLELLRKAVACYDAMLVAHAYLPPDGERSLFAQINALLAEVDKS